MKSIHEDQFSNVATDSKLRSLFGVFIGVCWITNVLYQTSEIHNISSFVLRLNYTQLDFTDEVTSKGQLLWVLIREKVYKLKLTFFRYFIC